MKFQKYVKYLILLFACGVLFYLMIQDGQELYAVWRDSSTRDLLPQVTDADARFVKSLRERAAPLGNVHADAYLTLLLLDDQCTTPGASATVFEREYVRAIRAHADAWKHTRAFVEAYHRGSSPNRTQGFPPRYLEILKDNKTRLELEKTIDNLVEVYPNDAGRLRVALEKYRALQLHDSRKHEEVLTRIDWHDTFSVRGQSASTGLMEKLKTWRPAVASDIVFAQLSEVEAYQSRLEDFLAAHPTSSNANEARRDRDLCKQLVDMAESLSRSNLGELSGIRELWQQLTGNRKDGLTPFVQLESLRRNIAARLCDAYLPVNQPLDRDVLIVSGGIRTPAVRDKVFVSWKDGRFTKLGDKGFDEFNLPLNMINSITFAGNSFNGKLEPTTVSEAAKRYNDFREQLSLRGRSGGEEKWTTRAIIAMRNACRRDESHLGDTWNRIEMLLNTMLACPDFFERTRTGT